MDDLAGLDWNSSASKPNSKPPVSSTANYFPTFKPTPPGSGRSTPASVPLNHTNKLNGAAGPPSKPATPANDSFAQLLPFGGGPKKSELSLEQQRRQLQEQRWGKEADRGRTMGQHGLNGPLGSTRDVASAGATSTPTGGRSLSAAFSQPSASVSPAPRGREAQDDLLAAFSADAPVDASTNFPPPSAAAARQVSVPTTVPAAPVEDDLAIFDDDPFELGSAAQIQPKDPQSQAPADDEDDVLGLLGKPVAEVSKLKAASPSPPVKPSGADAALAELVDMGFPIAQAQDALVRTASGTDVQAAVSWLLNQAHSTSRSRSRPPGGEELPQRPRREAPDEPRRARRPDEDAAVPAWMRNTSRSASGSRQREGSHDAGAEKDPAKYAAELGTNFLKTANSLWKSGAKKLNRAVADLNADGAAAQPKWMQPGPPGHPAAALSPASDSGTGVSPVFSPDTPSSVTDEAMLLEGGSGRPGRKPSRAGQLRAEPRAPDGERPASGAQARATTHRQTAEHAGSTGGRARLTRQALEEDVEVYVSPARRKKASPQPPAETLLAQSEPPAGKTSAPPRNPAPTASAPRPQQAPPPRPAPSRSPQPPRPAAPTRTIPPVSATALQSSATHRRAGTTAFKLGHYAEAGTHYTRALQPLPAQHPLAAVLLTNRALTHLKTGAPKACVADADAALALVGPGQGRGETVDLGGDEGTRELAGFWGKAMTRRAEALEQLEKWGDALLAWKACVEAGVGGATSAQGRARCEKAVGGATGAPRPAARRPPPATKPAPSRPAPPKSALDDLSGRGAAGAASNAEAVQRLRAANARAEQVDDEKFALADAVDARLLAWRKGKEGNLRALLGSLDAVLWADAGWRRVGMSELIVPARVKVAYMKGIAKVHPDKLPTTATTEQVMISGAVFSTLNEAWDKFKTENGL